MTQFSVSYALELLKTTRANMLQLHEGLSIEQLNAIPSGFNNNLVWNFGHVIATQQILCYGLSGKKAFVDNAFIDTYRKGTKPETTISQEAYNKMIELSEKAIKQTELDFAAGAFTEYKTYTTSYGMTLSNIEEAITFNNAHEGMHLGFSIALKKVITVA